MGLISNILGINKTPSPHADVFAKFEKSALLMSSQSQLNENREALFDLFASENWKALSLDDRKSAIQALENDFAFREGRPAKPVVLESMREGLYGGWYPEQDKICINERLVKDGTLYRSQKQPMKSANLQIMDTVIHEGYHAYQTHALENPDIHNDKAQLREWALNEGRYYGNGHEYFIQPQERDAWRFGYQHTSEILDGIEARNGHEPGREDYDSKMEVCSYDVHLREAEKNERGILDHMEQEMIAACEAKGINYDFSGESQNQTFVAKAEEGSLEQETPPELVNSPPEETEQTEYDMSALAVSGGEEKPESMTMDQLLAPDPSMAEKSASMDDIAPVHEQDSSETVEQSQSYSL